MPSKMNKNSVNISAIRLNAIQKPMYADITIRNPSMKNKVKYPKLIFKYLVLGTRYYIFNGSSCDSCCLIILKVKQSFI